MEVKGLKIAIGSSLDDFKAGIADVKSSLGGLGDFASSALGLLSNPISLATAAVVGIGAAAFQVGQDFDAAFDNIEAGTGASGAALEGLKADFEATFGNVPDSAADVSVAIADINTKLGLSGEPLQKMSEQFLNLARIPGQENLAGNIDAVSKSFNAWGVEADAQGTTLDFLLKTSQATGVSVADLSAKTTDAASTAKTLGLSYNETAVLIGQLEKTTGDSSGAMAGLTKAVAELTDSGIPAKDALGQIIGEIKNAPNDTAAGAAALEIFGKRAGTELAEQIRTGKFDLDELMGSIEASDVTVNGTADSIADFGEKFGELSNKVELVLAPLGAFLMDGLTAIAGFLADNFNPAMEFMGDLWDGLLDFIKPVTDYLKDTVMPALQTVGEVWLGLQLMLADKFIPVVTAVWNALKPLVTFIKDQVVAQIKLFFQNVQTLITWLGKIPGVSGLVEAAQKRVKQAFADTGTQSDTTKGKIETLTGVVDKARESQDKVGAPGGSAPKLSAAIRDAGKAHDEAKEKVERYTDAQNLAIEAANRAYDAELALANQTGALKDAFDDVEQPVIDVGGAVTGVDNAVLAVTTSMANADVAGSLEKWKTDAETKLPTVKGAFQTWGDGVQSIVSSLATDFVNFDFGDMGGKLTTIGESFVDVFQTKALDILTGPNGFITKGINVVTTALDGLISKITGGVGGALSNVFGGGIPGVGGGGGGGVSVPGVPGGSGGSVGAGGGGALGIINAVTGVGTLISSIFGNFQAAATNEYLDLIEKEARKIKNILGGDGQDSGISLKLKVIEEGIWYGPLVKATEDFRNKWFDFGLPVFRSLELQGAYIQPTLDHFGSAYFGPWSDKFDAIARNTADTAQAVRELQGRTASNSLAIEDLKTALEHNTNGLTTTARRQVLGRAR